ncbi:MAG: hypothetical protein U0V70_05580 [Terriglobia bacterium]
MISIGSSMILLANLIAILLSILAFGFSIYTLWMVRVSPYKLVVYSPAVSCVNPQESALVLDLTFHNPGRVRAAVLDIEASLLKGLAQTPFLRLRPQAFQRTFFPAGDLKSPQSVISRFAPITIEPGQTVSKTVYFSPPSGKSDIIERPKEVEWESIHISFKVNGNWNKRSFNIKRTDLDEPRSSKTESSLLRFPFVPTIYPDVQPLQLRGTFFDPVY